MFRKVTDIVLYKEPKINISNFLKGPKVVPLWYVINNTVLNIVSSGKQTRNSLRSRISVFSVLDFCNLCLSSIYLWNLLLFFSPGKVYCLFFIFMMTVFSRITSLALVQTELKNKTLRIFLLQLIRDTVPRTSAEL